MQERYGENCHRHGGGDHDGNTVRIVGKDRCRNCAHLIAIDGQPCAKHGGPFRGWGNAHRRVTPETCVACGKLRAVDGKPCKRHGGPPRGTDAKSRRERKRLTA